MKNIVYLAAIMCIWIASANIAAAQQTVTLTGSHAGKPEKKKKARKIETEFEWSSNYDFKNKLPGVEGSNVRNRTTVIMQFGKYRTNISGEIISATKADPDNVLGSIAFGASRNFNSVNVSVENTFYMKHRQRFGVIEAEIGKTKHLAEEVGITFFTNAAGFYALESSNNNVSNGFTWSNGAKFEGKLGKGDFETKAQIIADSNSIRKGRRLAGNIEVRYLYPIPNTRLKIGPKAEITGFWKGLHESHLEKRNVFNFGFVMKIM